jgi:hypothetical protein
VLSGLRATGGIIRAVRIEQDVIGNATGRALFDIALDQHVGAIVAGAPAEIVL